MEKDFYNGEEGLNLNQANFKFAIGALNFDNEARNDPRYVKWIARYLSWDNDAGDYV